MGGLVLGATSPRQRPQSGFTAAAFKVKLHGTAHGAAHGAAHGMAHGAVHDVVLSSQAHVDTATGQRKIPIASYLVSILFKRLFDLSGERSWSGSVSSFDIAIEIPQ